MSLHHRLVMVHVAVFVLLLVQMVVKEHARDVKVVVRMDARQRAQMDVIKHVQTDVEAAVVTLA